MQAALKTLETVSLAPANDVRLVRAWANDPALSEFFRRWSPLWLYSDEMLLQALATTYFVRVGEQPVGLLSLVGLDDHNKRAEVGLMIDKRLCPRRRLVAAQAIDQAADFLFNCKQYERIYMIVLASRTDLREWAKSVGFTEEGVFRHSSYFKGTYHDEVQLSLLRCEYEEARKKVWQQQPQS